MRDHGSGRRGEGQVITMPAGAAPAGREAAEVASPASPKLRLVRQAISGLTWCFTGLAGCRSGYFKMSGMAVPRRVKASRWALVGSVSIGTVSWVPVNRTWLRVKVARCSSSPRKLR